MLLYSSVATSFLSKLRNENSKSIMDYQCIVIYTIVRIAPLYPTPPSANEASSSSKREPSNGCLDWIKLQIKRYTFLYPITAHSVSRLDWVWGDHDAVFLVKRSSFDSCNQSVSHRSVRHCGVTHKQTRSGNQKHAQHSISILVHCVSMLLLPSDGN